MSEHVLDEQRRHYAARAPEYDDWWYRRGRYEVDAETKAAWEADIAEVEQAFAWRPPQRFDLCFFGFWLSHVPDARLPEFFELVRSALKPQGRVFLIDNGADDPAHARISSGGEEVRRLYDGREFRIVKRYGEPSGGTP